MKELRERIRRGLDSLRVFDVHTHLGSGGVWQARTLADLASYHWLGTELARAAERQFESEPAESPDAYMEEVAPHFEAVRNTSNHYAFMGIMRDLYGFEERTITPGNWRRADELVRSHAGDASWLASVLDKARIERLSVTARGGTPDASARWVPYEMGEPLFAAGDARALQRIVGKGGTVPGTAEALEVAIASRVDAMVAAHGVRALHVWYRGPWTYSEPDRATVDAALAKLARGEEPEPGARDHLLAFSADATGAAAARHNLVIQLFHGMGFHSPGVRDGCSSDWNPEYFRSLARHFARHEGARYDLFLGTRIPGHETASLARVNDNVMVSGAWWHAFTPTTMSEFFRDRLEMLPLTAWNAFYSDGYIVEWVYGKLLVTKNRLAHALSGMVDEGFLTEDDALDAAARLLYANAARVYCGE